MLSYQHAYHAGNPADVHKHVVLVMLMRRLQRKAGPIAYLDSHAGRGLYDLDGAEARKTAEAERGIRRLAVTDASPDGLRDYMRLVASFNAPGSRRFYPGSAAIAIALLREQDRAILLELHPQEVDALKRFVGGNRRVSVHARDAFEGLPALTPPSIKRGLVLIDPSYEIKAEYDTIPILLDELLARWAGGMVLLWYPLLPEARHSRLLRKIEAAKPPKALVSEYRFADPNDGLHGSGLVIVNTPWQFDAELADVMAHVVRDLNADGAVRYEQRWAGIASGRVS